MEQFSREFRGQLSEGLIYNTEPFNLIEHEKTFRSVVVDESKSNYFLIR